MWYRLLMDLTKPLVVPLGMLATAALTMLGGAFFLGGIWWQFRSWGKALRSLADSFDKLQKDYLEHKRESDDRHRSHPNLPAMP